MSFCWAKSVLGEISGGSFLGWVVSGFLKFLVTDLVLLFLFFFLIMASIPFLVDEEDDVQK